jgi:hypothetical protein
MHKIIILKNYKQEIFSHILRFLILTFAISTFTYADEIVTLNTRNNVTQTFLLLEPEKEIKGVVIMFPGHEGVIRISKSSFGQFNVYNEGGGFTVSKKTRKIYKKNGLAVALIAPPSDRQYGMDTEFRSSNEHLEDIKIVINYLQKKYNKDPYLHGHCRGSFSPASIVTKLRNIGVSGLILSSARSRGRHGAVTDYESNVVSVPVLLIQHKNDLCKGTPYRKLDAVIEFYQTSSDTVDTIVVEGGNTKPKKNGRVCQNGAHSFKGLQKETAQEVSNWILGKQFKTSISD